MACKVHRVRYYNPKPQPINCVSFNKTSKQIAVARGDASIEIWDLNYAPYLVKFIPGVENGSVEALGWAKNRLLSTGLGGALIEWDLEKLCLKTTVLLTGYAAWCLDVNPDNTLVAVGTEQGYVNLYNVDNDEIVYRKLFDKQEGRILCCKFNNKGDVLVTVWEDLYFGMALLGTRGLVIHGEKLISVGVDGYLTFSSYPPKWVMRLPPMIPAPRSSICVQKKLLLLRYSNHLEVWKLGLYATNNDGNVLISNVNTTLDSSQTENNDLEQDSTIDVISRAKAENTQKQTLKLTGKPTKLVSVQTKGKKQIQCCALSPSGELVVYSTASNIRMLKLDTEDEEQSNISLSKLLINGLPEGGYLQAKSILHLYISKKSPKGVTYLVVADTVGCISVWTQNAKKFEFYVSLPQYHCLPSALVVDSQREYLIVTYVDQKEAVEPVAKRKSKPGSKNVGLRIVPIKYLAGFHWMDQDEAVTLEVLPENIVSQLPPIAATKRHGHI
ncbi:hypothetical protein HF086_014535 [Spodoptera exigua]|uniref:WD repeat-containing protein 55 homolog n=1 Tax=Spodoptera exigua TaxID=7107 RepID=A0A922M9G5_SPOEX|nr:hypothetical protein HF086_014535 [Spodoptera exigua]